MVTDVAPGAVTVGWVGSEVVVPGVDDVVVGAVVDVVLVVVAGSELSLSWPLPPVKITSDTISSTTATAPAARATSAPGWFHQPPEGDSYSGAYPQPSPPSPPPDAPPAAVAASPLSTPPSPGVTG